MSIWLAEWAAVPAWGSRHGRPLRTKEGARYVASGGTGQVAHRLWERNLGVGVLYLPSPCAVDNQSEPSRGAAHLASWHETVVQRTETRRYAGLGPLYYVLVPTSPSPRPFVSHRNEGPMYRMTILYPMPPGPVAFRQHYLEEHIPLARRMQGLRQWRLQWLDDGDEDRTACPPWILIADLCTDDEETMNRMLASPEGATARADVDTFATGPVQYLRGEEQEINPS